MNLTEFTMLLCDSFKIFYFPEEEYNFGCILPLVPSYLEVREDHTLIKQLTEEVLGSQLIAIIINN